MAERLGRLAAPVLLLLLTSAAQFHQLTRDLRFLPDEAFFMTFARGAAVNGDWLLPGALDKPPLSIYVSALSMAAIAVAADDDGVLHLDPIMGEFAGRLPNVFLAIMLTAIMMRLAGRHCRSRWAALLAGLLTATSPYLLAFGASALTDMSLLFWAAAALYFSLGRRWALAGAALGLAFWSKQQAALFAPLIVMILLTRGGRRQDWLRVGLPLVILGAALLVWDDARPEPSIFAQAALNNSPERWLVDITCWPARLADWLGRGLWLLGPALVSCGLLAGAAFAMLRRTSLRTARSWPLSVERALLLYTACFLGAHVVLPFNLYDRYLLLILPPLALLVAGQLARMPFSGAQERGLRLGLLALIAAGGLWSLNTETSVGGSRAAYAGLDALAAHLNAKPVATVIYDPWLGWELDYYLGQWHDKRRVHFPSAEALAAGALALDEIGDRYFVAPMEQPHDDWLAALRRAGFGVAVDYESDGFAVYRLKVPKD